MVIAVLEEESDHADLAALLASATCRMSVANWLEASVVADSRLAEGNQGFDRLVSTAEIEIVPVTVEQGRIARQAYRRFGRGSGSPARLNFGDCFAYALAVDRDEPLLFKGDDFVHTDVRSARGG